jgi:hypothetical protein
VGQLSDSKPVGELHLRAAVLKTRIHLRHANAVAQEHHRLVAVKALAFISTLKKLYLRLLFRTTLLPDVSMDHPERKGDKECNKSGGNGEVNSL